MNKSIKNYRTTTIHWGRTQADIMKLLNSKGIVDVQFTTIGADTAARSGYEMKPGCYGIVLLFQKTQKLPDGTSGAIPVRILLPNIRQDDPKALNQFYRVLFWYLKTKFEAIDTGLVEFAEEFMPHLQLNQGGVVVRAWDAFKRGYYRAIGSGEQGNDNLLPPMKGKNG